MFVSFSINFLCITGRTFYAQDLIMWRGHAFNDCTAEFRLCWLHSKMAEEGGRYGPADMASTSGSGPLQSPGTLCVWGARPGLNTLATLPPAAGASSEALDMDATPSVGTVPLELSPLTPSATAASCEDMDTAEAALPQLACPSASWNDLDPGTPFFRLNDSHSGLQFRQVCSF